MRDLMELKNKNGVQVKINNFYSYKKYMVLNGVRLAILFQIKTEEQLEIDLSMYWIQP